ncbi:terminase large subunit domain-containing protein [Terasakiella pusilla]|uniref:terminase large subunit domain-containing protein n=1 Tax=Terasakiella pusilla TaxID=64973 RepID=UPI003AA89AB4
MAETVDRDIRERAQLLYWQGHTIADVARMVEKPYATVDAWKRRDKWGNVSMATKTSKCLEARYIQLLAMPTKSDAHLKELDTLDRMLNRAVERAQGGGENAEGSADRGGRGKRRKRKEPEKNALSDEDIAKLREDFEKNLFGYQYVWLEARGEHRTRNILKSRQIGATWYFAREALMNAIETGDNQIFLSASKAQAYVFREYIIQWVKDVCDVTLRGDPIKLWNGATLYFLGTNSRTAQSYHGHMYMDEIFWIPKFKEFKKVASGMATHKKWTKTYFSTPSSVSHEAHPFWTGKEFNKGRKEEDQVQIDVSHDALKDGRLCEDGQWRQIVTIEDAVRSGCDLFDIEQLKLEYNEQDYGNLFMCQFIDDHASYFNLKELQACMVDAWDKWSDYDFDERAKRPYGDLPVWIGYDPSRFHDDASIVVVAPPLSGKKKYRVLEKLKFNGKSFEVQAAAIKALTEKYNVQHIGIDKSSIGLGVFEQVQQFFPAVQGVSYSVEVKNRLVLKAKQLISRGLLEFDCSMTDIAMAFMTIRKTTTASGRQTTFQASRSGETGHADVAWALMHAVQHEGLAAVDSDTHKNSASIVEIYEDA